MNTYNQKTLMIWCALCAFVLAGCSSDNAPPPTVGSATINATTGGEVTGPDNTKLIVPAGAIDSAITFRMARDSTDAPELQGLNAVSPIYAVTPHGQQFEGSARISIPLAAAQQLPSGATPLLLKAEQGGQWRVLQNISTDPSQLAADIDGLSWYVIGSCIYSSVNQGWTIGNLDCPGVDHQLQLTMYDNDTGAPIVRGTGVNMPLVEVIDEPRTLQLGVQWRRPLGTNRTDHLSVIGLPSGFNNTGFSSNWRSRYTNVLEIGPTAGNSDVPFTVTIDPAQVPGANRPSGKMLRVRANVEYQAAAFRIGTGNVTVGFIFEVDVPILVRYNGPQPVIAQHPANVSVAADQPASFSVQASISTSTALTYQWLRRPDSSSSFTPITGATTSSYTLAQALLQENGTQFQVQVCAATRCVTSNAATLTVSQTPLSPVFTVQPANATFLAGQTASFSVTASGSPLPHIDWESAPASNPGNFTAFTATNCGRTNPPGSGTTTSATCTVGPLDASDDGRLFRAVATNSGTSVHSNTAMLIRTEQPTITQPPVAQAANAGQPVTLNVEATGASLTYQWLTSRRIGFDSFTLFEDIAGATSSSHVIPAATIADDQSLYAVRVCNGPAQLPSYTNCVFYGLVSYESVRLTINPIVSQNFAVVASGTQANLNAVAFANATTGVAVGTSGTVLRTTDGGQNWAEVSSGTTADLLAVAMTSTGNGVALGTDVLLYTSNYGADWSEPTSLMSGSGCCYDVAFADATTAVLARNSYNGFWRSTNGGQTFATNIGLDIDNTHLVRFGSATVGAGAAGAGALYYTTDAGSTWTAATQSSEFGAFKMAYATSAIAVASDVGGHLARTTDGGQTWTEQFAGGYTRASNALAFNNAGVGLSVGDGDSYQMMRTPDYGVTWVPLELPAVPSGVMAGIMNSVTFVDSNVVIAVGNEGTIVRFTAGGL